MTQEERAAWLADTCTQIAKIRKSAKEDKNLSMRFSRLYQKETIPDYWDGYKEAVETYKAGRLHAYGEFPEGLFAKIKPNQRPEDYEYMREVYEPITKDVYLEFGNTCKKALINGAIEFPEVREGNPLKDFLENGIENFDSLMGWASAMMDTKLLDGMGIVGAWPTNIEVNDNGELISELQAQPVLYPVPYLVYVSQDSKGAHYIVESKNKSVVISHGKQKQIGYIYRYFGPEFIAEAKQVGKETDDTFEVEFILEHEIGFTPATRLEGIARLVESEVRYDSVFSLAVPHLNKAVVNETGLSAIMHKVMYPTRVRVAEKCNHQEGGSYCEDGQITYFDNDKATSIKKTCPACMGTGNKLMGILSEIIVNAEREIGSDTSTNLNALNVMSYISPPVDAPKFTSDQVDKAIKQAQEVLHLKAEPRGSGPITATEKHQDEKNRDAFIKPISDQTWRIIGYLVEVIGKMMFADRYEALKPQIHPAESFDAVTSEELGTMIAAAKKEGMPSFIVQQMAEDYVNLMQTTSAKADQIAKLLVSSDRLLVMSELEVMAQLSRKLVERWEVYYHSNPTFIIEAVYGDNPGLFDLSMDQQLELIRLKAIEKTPSEGQALPPPIDPGG